MINKYGFYLPIGEEYYFIFWRNLANVMLLIICSIFATALYKFLKKKKEEEKTVTYYNSSTINYKWKNKAFITFPDLTTFFGKLKNNLPHGKGIIKNSDTGVIKVKFEEGDSSLLKIFKTEDGYNYQIKEKSKLAISTQFSKIIKWLIIVNCIALIIGIAKLPYGYYTLLRLITTTTACIITYYSYKTNKIKLMIIYGLIVLVYNPIKPIPLNKDNWIVINVITIFLFLFFQKQNNGNS